MDWQTWHDEYFTGEPQPLATGERMFTFVGYDVLAQTNTRAGEVD